MNATVRMKASQLTKDWHVIDAAGRPLGRVATEAATLLRGKHKPTFEPHLDGGDFVIIVNASKVEVTGRKAAQRRFYRHSGYPGGLKSRSWDEQFSRHPDRVVEKCVWGMLPKGTLGEQMLKHLKVYRGPDHPHQSQITGSERARAARETAAAGVEPALPLLRKIRLVPLAQPEPAAIETRKSRQAEAVAAEAEAPAPTPARRTRAKAEAPVAEAAPAAAAPKPARRTRAKAETPVAEATPEVEAPPAAAAAKPARRTRAKAADPVAEAPEVEAPKPARRTRASAAAPTAEASAAAEAKKPAARARATAKAPAAKATAAPKPRATRKKPDTEPAAEPDKKPATRRRRTTGTAEE